jgi:hypothetical protein
VYVDAVPTVLVARAASWQLSLVQVASGSLPCPSPSGIALWHPVLWLWLVVVKEERVVMEVVTKKKRSMKPLRRAPCSALLSWKIRERKKKHINNEFVDVDVDVVI